MPLPTDTSAIKLANMCSEMKGAIGELSRAFLKAHEVLLEINKYNRINNDLQAYLFNLVEWGVGKCEKRPTPESFGLPAEDYVE